MINAVLSNKQRALVFRSQRMALRTEVLHLTMAAFVITAAIVGPVK